MLGIQSAGIVWAWDKALYGTECKKASETDQQCYILWNKYFDRDHWNPLWLHGNIHICMYLGTSPLLKIPFALKFASSLMGPECKLSAEYLEEAQREVFFFLTKSRSQYGGVFCFLISLFSLLLFQKLLLWYFSLCLIHMTYSSETVIYLFRLRYLRL